MSTTATLLGLQAPGFAQYSFLVSTAADQDNGELEFFNISFAPILLGEEVIWSEACG